MHDSHSSGAILVGRQAICTADERVVAYELLHRDPETLAPSPDGNRATAEVLLATIVDIGLDTLVGSRPAFVNLPREFLLGRDMAELAPDRVVLEVLESVEADADVTATLRALVQRGFRIALDDYVPGDHRADLLSLASIVKYDVRAAPIYTLGRELERVRRPGLTLLAEKVETRAELEALRALGFDWFQGYFFGRPEIVAGRATDASLHAVLALVAELQDPNKEADDLARCVQRDVGLAYRLVRYVNSASFAPVQTIQTVRDAVLRLGRPRIRNLATLMLLAGSRGASGARIAMAMVRARMCELVAQARDREHASVAFTVGLFSCLDSLLGAPIEDLLKPLPLDPLVSRAILERAGPLGQILDGVIAYERCDWERALAAPIPAEQMRASFLEALRWSEEIERSVENR